MQCTATIKLWIFAGIHVYITMLKGCQVARTSFSAPTTQAWVNLNFLVLKLKIFGKKYSS